MATGAFGVSTPRTRIQNDVQRILEVYRRSGRFAATVEPKVIELEQNRVDLVFEIDEGPLTEVQRISFVGNEAFSDSTLRGEIATSESRWWRIFATEDTYDPDRLNFDRELLRRFYLAEGYADFRVVSAVAELTPDRDAFFITITVDEGPRYTFGDIDISTSLLRTWIRRNWRASSPPESRATGTSQRGWFEDNPSPNLIRWLVAEPSNSSLRRGRPLVTPGIGPSRRISSPTSITRAAVLRRTDSQSYRQRPHRRPCDPARVRKLVEGDPFNVSRLRQS